MTEHDASEAQRLIHRIALLVLVLLGCTAAGAQAQQVDAESNASALEDDHSEAQALLDGARAARDEGDMEEARLLGRLGIEVLADGARGHQWSRLLARLSRVVGDAGDLELARSACALTVEWAAEAPGRDDTFLAEQRGNLAGLLDQLGLVEEARDLEEEVLAAFDRILAPDHLNRAIARSNLAVRCMNLGDYERGRELLTEAIEIAERSPGRDEPFLLILRTNLASVRNHFGDKRGAIELITEVVVARERSLPAHDPALMRSLGSLAGLLSDVGHTDEARSLMERTVRGLERAFSSDHPQVRWAHRGLARLASLTGDHNAAIAMRTKLLEEERERLPAGHPSLRELTRVLASDLRQAGRTRRGRELLEELLAECEELLPADHLDVLEVRLELALALREEKDHVGALAVLAPVLESFQAARSPDDLGLLRAVHLKANVLAALGRHDEALVLFERVLEGRLHVLPPDHIDVLSTRHGIASLLLRAGDNAEARARFAELVEDCERALPPDHAYILNARANLCSAMERLGEYEQAVVLLRECIDAYDGVLPLGHGTRVAVHKLLTRSLAKFGDLEGARTELEPLARELLAQLSQARVLPPREARAVVGYQARNVDVALSVSAGESDFAALGFSLVESARLAAVTPPGWGQADDAEATVLRESLRDIRQQLNDAAGSSAASSNAGRSASVTELALERDRLEGALRRHERERAGFTDLVRAQDVARHLETGTAAVSYSRYSREWRDDEGGDWRSEDSMLAHVVRPDGTVTRVELGSASELTALAAEWRASIGEPVHARGIIIQPPDEAAVDADADTIGKKLRARCLDSVLAAAGDVRQLHIVPDDMLFVIPFEALPVEDGFVGDLVRITLEASFARLLTPRPERSDPARESHAVLLGDVNYSAAIELEMPPLANVTTPWAPSERSEAFAALPGALAEIVAIEQLFEASGGTLLRVLAGDDATKGNLFAAAPDARFLHVATHGWFAPESVSSIGLDRSGSPIRSAEITDAVTQFAPMALCGLALAGANRGRDSIGRTPGLLTAEELSGLDLSQCELCVLSACETNVGIRRAGQGIQSLQAALHAAGARTTITSLWKVDDRSTSELMGHFYENLWMRGMTKSDALWAAQCALRAAGQPPSAWAAWVLSGDPR